MSLLRVTDEGKGKVERKVMGRKRDRASAPTPQMHELTKIAMKIGRTDKALEHIHTEFYGPLLESKREIVRNVLEIGISGGGSHLMWAEFFPNAIIWGVDIERPENGELKELDDHERIRLFFENAYKRKFVNKIKRQKFDLIIDDGPHTEKPWRFFLEQYTRLLADQGVLILEDIYTIPIAQDLIKGFSGDKNRLSIIDRRMAPDSFQDYIVFTDADGSQAQEFITNEILLLYM